MKTFSTICVLLFIANIGFTQQNPSYHNLNKTLGLVSSLTIIKGIAEYKCLTVHSEKDVDKIKTINRNYDQLKISVDILINQMTADLIVQNNMRLYKVLNKYVKGKKSKVAEKRAAYTKLLTLIDTIYTNRILNFNIDKSSGLGETALEQITGAVALLHTGIIDARDFREKKIQALLAVLEKLRLQSIKDLTTIKE